jgi:hypothetical protein
VMAISGDSSRLHVTLIENEEVATDRSQSRSHIQSGITRLDFFYRHIEDS